MSISSRRYFVTIVRGRPPLARLAREEDLRQVRVHRKIDAHVALFLGAPVELLDRQPHVVDGDVDFAGPHDRLLIAERARHPIHVPELAHRRPAFVSAPPRASRSEPHRERLGEVFVGMLLRVPPFHVAHVVAAERHRPVLVAIRPIERPEGRHASRAARRGDRRS